MIPIHTNIWPRRRPYANYGLIGLTVLIFLASYNPGLPSSLVPIRQWAFGMMLRPADWRLWQIVTYAFLHGGLLHLLGNMFFLYLFGNNVNDKLGHLGYLCFYLAGAAFSGLTHVFGHGHSLVPTLGASGAVAAVTGAYLVLYPRSLITVLYWFFFIGTVEIPALWFIGIKMILLDNVIIRSSPFIAYDAHLGGYAFGAGVTLLLLGVRLLPTNHLDLWSLLVQWNRRRRYRTVVAKGYDPFTGTRVVQPSGAMASVTVDPRIADLRAQISQRIAEHNLSMAARAYLELMAIDHKQVIGREALLDVANQLASEGLHAQAAQAYQQYLSHYPGSLYQEQVMLMLGLLYARYIGQPEKARRHLTAALELLTDPGQRQLCRQELERLGN